MNHQKKIYGMTLATIILILFSMVFGTTLMWKRVLNFHSDQLSNQIKTTLEREVSEGNYFTVSANLDRLRMAGIYDKIAVVEINESKVRWLYSSYNEFGDSLFSENLISNCFNPKFEHSKFDGKKLLFSVPLKKSLYSMGGVCAIVSSELSSDLLNLRFLVIWIFLAIASFSIIGLAGLIVRLNKEQLKFQKIESQKKLEKADALSHLASQVAHDIRSPLAALKMVTEQLSNIPEDRRILIRSSVARINDISNELLNKGKELNKQSSSTNDKSSEVLSKSIFKTELLSPIIDTIVSEKRIQFRSMQNVEIEADLNSGYGFFSNINSTELKRAISNLITNAVEAFPNGKGKVVIGIRKNGDNEITIMIQDNGKGIPENILKKLGEMGVSHGKEGTQSGSGLGVYHAKKSVEESGGQFRIQSIEGKGTTITMNFNRAKAPSWFVEKILLNSGMIITSLDDDISIHQIWKDRFETIKILDNGITHKTYTDGLDFKTWVTQSESVNLKCTNQLFLVDYELLNQRATGLDLIEELGISSQSILVTSRYEEEKIRQRCDILGIKLIPKAMAGFVPIEYSNRKDNFYLIDDSFKNNLPNQSNEMFSKNEKKIRYDLCLIDDDKALVHTIWGMVANSKGHNIKMYTTIEEFQSEADSIDLTTPIFIDVSLGNGVSGVEFSKIVHEKGFLNINLATGYSPDSINAPGFISRVIGKDYPDYL